ncbi:MAG: type II secretion system protein [Chthoniobacterales bacterium]
MDLSLEGKARRGFTLIEMLVVITIIVTLMAFLFPAFRAVQDQAKRTQAKNDLTQIVTAVNAFYTEYGKYPLATDDAKITENANLLYVLRAVAAGANAVDAVNPRKIVFLSPPDVKDNSRPRSGLNTNGQYFDPWGSQYLVALDGNYDDQIANPYTGNAGSAQLRLGVIAWSLGKDGLTSAGDKKAATSDDDVISWQ